MVFTFCPGGLLSDVLFFAWMVSFSVNAVLNNVGGGLVFAFFCGGLLLEVLFLAWMVPFSVGAVLLEFF